VSIQSLVTGLTAAGIEFVVVGGVAGAVQGSPFVTNDLDICYAANPANVTRLAKALARWKPYPREWDEGLPFTMDARAIRTTPLMTLRTVEGDIDLLDRVAGVGDYTAALESSEEVTAFNIRFRVLTLEALIRSRRAAARPKDLAQLATLEAMVELRRSEE
jgi:predicted nucleotidyltransferase